MAEPEPAPPSEKAPKPEPKLEKRVIEMPDGRYLIVYGRPGA